MLHNKFIIIMFPIFCQFFGLHFPALEAFLAKFVPSIVNLCFQKYPRTSSFSTVHQPCQNYSILDGQFLHKSIEHLQVCQPSLDHH